MGGGGDGCCCGGQTDQSSLMRPDPAARPYRRSTKAAGPRNELASSDTDCAALAWSTSPSV